MPIMSRTNLFAVCLLTAACGSALAQDALGKGNALGQGNALDANPGQYGPNNAPRASLVDELRFRNAIATGNAPGGLSFRGDLGYRAAGEFTGALGSDALFAFRRDSLYSGLAGMGIRGTDAIQYQFALTTGSTPPRNLMGNLSYSRDSYASTGASLPSRGGGGQSGPLSINREQDELDTAGRALSVQTRVSDLESGSMMGTLRSSSIYNTTSTMQPSLLSVYTQGLDNRPVGLVASPLLGITPTPLVDERPENPLVARPSVPPGQQRTTEEEDRPTNRLTTAYDELVEEMRERVQRLREAQEQEQGDRSIRVDESNDAWLVRQMEEIRRRLYGVQEEQDDQGDKDQQPVDEENEDKPGERENLPDRPPSEAPTDAGEDTPVPGASLIPVPDNTESPAAKAIAERREELGLDREDMRFELRDPTDVAIDPDTREVLIGVGAREVKQLLVPGASNDDLYSRHILAGQRLIESGRYFEAEERFTHALSMKPGDVVAQIGRLNAQIGAGLLLSASVNLQTLYSDHPELITTRYSEGVIPGAERIAELKQSLGERAGIIEPPVRTRQPDPDRVRVSAGLLLAYIGYQTRDRDAIRDGIEVVRTLGTDSDRRFASVLEQLWVPDGDATSTEP